MKKYLFCFILFFTVSHFAASPADTTGTKDNTTVYISNFYVYDNTGKAVTLDTYTGKVLLIVNVASQCGFTKQYEGLEKLYEKYKGRGFEILAFPCNDFGGQEPGTNDEIKAFCTSKFGVQFRLFDKIKILGDDESPLYTSLENAVTNDTGTVKWNFEKFLIGKAGDVVARYRSKVEPLDESLVAAIERELAK